MRRLAFATAVGLLVLAAALTHERALALRGATPVDAHTFAPPPRMATLLSVGENELMADLAWVKTLIYYGDGMAHNTGIPDVESLIELINRLDPMFRRPYLWGAYATTFRKQVATADEYAASVEVLRRAIAQFPADWEFSWLLGLRLYFDVKSGGPDEKKARREEAITYIERAMRLPGAPGDLPLLAASLRTELGQKERALRELREMILNTEDETARAQLRRRYAVMATEAASKDLVAEAKKVDDAWKATLPYVPRTAFILLGPPPAPGIDLAAMARGNAFDADSP